MGVRPRRAAAALLAAGCACAAAVAGAAGVKIGRLKDAPAAANE